MKENKICVACGMRESEKEFKEFQKLIKKFKDGSAVDTLFVPYNTEPIVMIARSKFIEYYEKIRKPLEDEIIELKEHIRALKSSHDLSHQAYLFAKNEGLDLQQQERQKVVAELEEFICKNSKTRIISAYDDESEYDTERHINFQALRQKLNDMKGE